MLMDPCCSQLDRGRLTSKSVLSWLAIALLVGIGPSTLMADDADP